MATILSRSQVVLTTLFLLYTDFSAGSVLPPAFVRRQLLHNSAIPPPAHIVYRSLTTCTSDNDCDNDWICHARICEAPTLESSSTTQSSQSRLTTKAFTKRGLSSASSIGLSIAIPTLIMICGLIVYIIHKRRKARVKCRKTERNWVVTPYNPADLTIPKNPPPPPLPPQDALAAERKLSAISTPSTIDSYQKEDYFEKPMFISNPPPPPPPPTKSVELEVTASLAVPAPAARPMTPAELEGSMPDAGLNLPSPSLRGDGESINVVLDRPHFPSHYGRDSVLSYSEITDVSSLYSPQPEISPGMPSPPVVPHRPVTQTEYNEKAYHEIVEPPPVLSPALSDQWASGDDSPTLGRTNFAVSMMVPSNKRPSLLQQISASSFKTRYSRDMISTPDTYRGRPLTAMQQKSAQQKSSSATERLSSHFSNFNMRASSGRQSRFPVVPVRSPLKNLLEADGESLRSQTVRITVTGTSSKSSSVISLRSSPSHSALSSPRSATTDDLPDSHAPSSDSTPSPPPSRPLSSLRSRSQDPIRSHLVRQSSGLRRVDTVKYNEPTTPASHQLPPLPPANMPLPPSSATRMTVDYVGLSPMAPQGGMGHTRGQSVGTSAMRSKRMTVFNQPVQPPSMARGGRTGRV